VITLLRPRGRTRCGRTVGHASAPRFQRAKRPERHAHGTPVIDHVFSVYREDRNPAAPTNRQVFGKIVITARAASEFRGFPPQGERAICRPHFHALQSSTILHLAGALRDEWSAAASRSRHIVHVTFPIVCDEGPICGRPS